VCVRVCVSGRRVKYNFGRFAENYANFVRVAASILRNNKTLTLYRMVMPIGTPFLKEKINN